LWILGIGLWIVAFPAPLMARDEGRVATIRLAGHEVAVVGALGSFDLTVGTLQVEPDIEIARLRLASEVAAPPPRLTLRWSLPSHDVQGLWTTAAGQRKTIGPDWYMSSVDSKVAQHAPVLSLYGGDDDNRLTFAVSDALNTVFLRAGVREEDARIYGRIELFSERHRAVTEIEFAVRFDRRGVPFHEVLADVADWWAEQPGYSPATVPEVARLPMYSTWYSYHQSVEAGALLREVEIAKGLGYEAIIVDDGWQTLDSARGYAYTGDWEPERIPGMKAFVDDVHQRGMKLLLWYAVPLVGERSKVFPRFEGKYLRYWDGQGAWELDPRYPEVRTHIIDTYRSAIRDWGVDGFKLDFLGRFVANDATELTAVDGRDYASVNEATDRLMTDILAELRKVNPAVTIEFRQPYIGPLMRKYGNMFRAGDAPNAAIANRIRTVDLRLLSGDTAVHSDMFMWHYQESVEAAARQLLNVLFSVPQLSVRLGEIPDEHLRMVRFYTDYWRRNRSILLDGRFEPASPLENYPLVVASAGDKQIVVAYGDRVLPLSSDRPLERIDLVNATPGDRLVVEAREALGRYRIDVLDAIGRPVANGERTFGLGAHTIEVPPSGLVTLSRLGDD
jgi:alpha-galactosidase